MNGKSGGTLTPPRPRVELAHDDAPPAHPLQQDDSDEGARA